MQLLQNVHDIQTYRQTLNGSVGFVPTMGALHKGHLSLMRASMEQNQHTLVSIFVNPTQFGENEDFGSYPRTLEQDLSLCRETGVDAVFAPSVDSMYSKDEMSFNPPRGMASVLEGADRPHHFGGVLQIVLKLFMLSKPTRAYFGQKDAQQVLLIQKMVNDLFLDTHVVSCPIVRDEDGLALSSRNIYLNTQERKQALAIPNTIQRIHREIEQGKYDVAYLEKLALENLKDLEVCYASFYSRSLGKITHITLNESIFLIAAKVGKVRLLDNLWI